jgi:putative transposase
MRGLMTADTSVTPERGRRSAERLNRCNGYRTREWDTQAGVIELAIPNELRSGTYFPDWLLECRR